MGLRIHALEVFFRHRYARGEPAACHLHGVRAVSPPKSHPNTARELAALLYRLRLSGFPNGLELARMADSLGPVLARRIIGLLLESAIVSSFRFDYTRPPIGEAVTLSTTARTLQMAADRLGGLRPLARFLQVPLPDLYAWMRPGAEPPPMAIFLKAVDILLNGLSAQDARRAETIRVAALDDERRSLDTEQTMQKLTRDFDGKQ
jgi:hypothetical protein